MDEQMAICVDGSVKGELERKIETAIKRLQSFEPPEGYYVAFSGGKDSQCIYHLCKLGGVKFDAHYGWQTEAHNHVEPDRSPYIAADKKSALLLRTLEGTGRRGAHSGYRCSMGRKH